MAETGNMAYSKIRQPKLSDVIEQQLEFLILEGTLRPGEKLPPERELAKQFDVSRPSLREAIQRLEAKGLLLRRQGGGTFVQSRLWQSFSDPLVELLSDHPESQFDLLETRHALEGIAAYYAIYYAVWSQCWLRTFARILNCCTPAGKCSRRSAIIALEFLRR